MSGRTFHIAIKITYLTVLFFLISPLTAHAAAISPPSGLRWGMSVEICQEVLSAAGYERIVPEIPALSTDRLLRRRKLTHGLRTERFERQNRDSTEVLEVFFYEESLFRVVCAYEDFGRGFREQMVERLTADLGFAPRHMQGMNSGMHVYEWQHADIIVQFRYREVPTLPLYFAEISYSNILSVEYLKNIGLL